MGQRRELRKEISLAVRIFGTDSNGKAFSENIATTNISHEGARLTGVQAKLKPGEIIGLAWGKNKGRFTVRWCGPPGTAFAGEVGLQNVAPEKVLWDVPLPAPGIDEYGRHLKGTERRRHPRLKCTNSVELQAQGETAPIWGKAVELSLGGCFIEMPMPLKEGTKLKIALWVKEKKLWATAKVVSSRPGFGIGVQFLEVAEEDMEQLKQFLKSIPRMPM